MERHAHSQVAENFGRLEYTVVTIVGCTPTLVVIVQGYIAGSNPVLTAKLFERGTTKTAVAYRKICSLNSPESYVGDVGNS